MTVIHFGCADCDEKDRTIMRLEQELRQLNTRFEYYKKTAVEQLEAARFNHLKVMQERDEALLKTARMGGAMASDLEALGQRRPIP